jgi:hypothetical protein
MLSSCLNPLCKASFRYLYDGRIFTVEQLVTSPDGQSTERVIEHYWLCGECSRSMKVVVENGVATAVPIPAKLMVLSGAKAAAQQLQAG